MRASEEPLPDPYLNPQAPGSGQGGGPSKTSGTAIAALSLSLLSFFCFPAIGGLLGIVLGVAAKGEIERSQGRRGGSAMAVASIVLGSLNLVLTIVGFALLIALMARPSTTASSPAPVPAPWPMPAPTFAPPAPLPAPTGSAPSSGQHASSQLSGVTESKVGSVALVDVGPDAGSLTEILGKQRAEASKAGDKLVLWLVAPDCQPCNGVAASLADPRMQQALSRVRLLRVNVRDYPGELRYLNVPVDKIPGFALIGSTGRPVDYVHGGEWDEDIPKNIAPVLGKFVQGKYAKRRDPWQGGRREDETAL